MSSRRAESPSSPAARLTSPPGRSSRRASSGSNASIGEDESLATLGARLDIIEHERGLRGNRLYYLAIAPALFVPTVRQLDRARFIVKGTGPPSVRIVIEKPIGHDLASARAINDAIAQVFDEQQIYRIDHYLGKETVQNILVLRFANSIFEPLFNQKYIDHVQVTVAEAEGVGSRAGYYETAGALRDMVQNHLLQLLSLVAMEPPRSLDADVIRDEKIEVLQSLRPLRAEDVDACAVRAQYEAGFVRGEPVRGYREEPGVDPESRTETFVALFLWIDNWRWAGVPFFLRTGKRLPKRASEISVHLKEVPPILFNSRAARRARPERPVDSHSARRGVRARNLVEDSRTARAGLSGADGFSLWQHVRRNVSRSLRTAAARRDGRRPDAFHAARPGGSRLAVGDADSRSVGGGTLETDSDLRGW